MKFPLNMVPFQGGKDVLQNTQNAGIIVVKMAFCDLQGSTQHDLIAFRSVEAPENQDWLFGKGVFPSVSRNA